MNHVPLEAPRYASRLAMKGQAHIVPGAGQGIGEQAAHALAQQGARVLCVDLDAARAQSVARAVDGEALSADVTQRSEMRRVFAEADRLFGSSLFGIVDVDDAFWTARAREIPMGRVADTADIASAILFFCSGLARHVTGNILPVDGGSHDLGESPYVPAIAANTPSRTDPPLAPQGTPC